MAWAEAGNPQLSLYSRIGVAFDTLPEGLSALLAAQDRRPKKLKARAKK